MTLIGWWPLHDNNAQDYSGNNNHGTLNGGVTTGVAGRGGLEAYSFDGTEDELAFSTDFTNPPINDNYITLSFWCNPDGDWSDSNQFFRVQDEWALQTPGNSTANLRLVSWGNNVDFNNSVLAANKWQHVVLLWDCGNSVKVYINGSLTDSTSYTDTSSDSGNTPIISYGGSYAGTLCDFRYYDRALSPSEIQTLYEWGSADLAQPPTDGVARYALDGDATDSWGNNDGTNNGVTFTNNAIRGQAGEFDGSARDYINTTDIIGNQSQITISAWVKVKDGFDTNNPCIIGSWGGGYDNYVALFSGGSEWLFITDDGDEPVASGGSTNSGSWNHIVGVFDNGSKWLYQNGVEIDSAETSLTTLPSFGDNSIGHLAGGGDYGFDGLIDDVRIYDRALSPAEVQKLYRWGTKGVNMNKYTVMK